MNILVHICCADCGIKLADTIRTELGIGEEDITLYFYNPNIHPESEFRARADAVKAVFRNRSVKLVLTNWTPAEYFGALRMRRADRSAFSVWKKEDRCPVCWRVRLDTAFRYASDQGYETVTTTLFSSLYHDAGMLRQTADALAGQYGLKLFVPENIDRCRRTAGFYKQNYEGCIYSLVERMHGKYGMDGFGPDGRPA